MQEESRDRTKSAEVQDATKGGIILQQGAGSKREHPSNARSVTLIGVVLITMKLHSPAKINLFLEVLEERDDGFHEIESLMTAVSLFDEIELQRADETSVNCDHPGVPDGPDNLVHRAIRRFRDETGMSDGIQVNIDKNIPPGSGLGGGSSNAGTVLRGLNTLLDDPLDHPALMDIGQHIGSDVNFFLNGPAAICRGRGEQVSETSLPAQLHFLVIMPDVTVKTPIVYRKSGKFLNSSPKRVNVHHSYLVDGRTEDALFNRLYEPAISAYPSLETWFDRVRDLASLTPHLSGSGSALFLAHPERRRIEEEAGRLAPMDQLSGVAVRPVHSLPDNWDPFVDA